MKQKIKNFRSHLAINEIEATVVFTSESTFCKGKQ